MARALRPVSYTHLDVYKRQGFCSILVPFTDCPCSDATQPHKKDNRGSASADYTSDGFAMHDSRNNYSRFPCSVPIILSNARLLALRHQHLELD